MRRRAGWKCGMECVIIFRLLAGRADLANGRERRLPHSLRIATEENFYVRQYAGVEGMLFSRTQGALQCGDHYDSFVSWRSACLANTALASLLFSVDHTKGIITLMHLAFRLCKHRPMQAVNYALLLSSSLMTNMNSNPSWKSLGQDIEPSFN